MKRSALLLPLILLAACAPQVNINNRGATPSRPPSSSPSPSAGPSAYLAAVRASGLGDKDPSSSSDSDLLSLGNTVCSTLGNGGTLTYGDVVQVIVDSDAKATPAQADVLIRTAVNNLCPANKAKLP